MGMKPIMMRMDRHGLACSRYGSKLPMEAAVLIGNLLEQMFQILTRLAGIHMDTALSHLQEKIWSIGMAVEAAGTLLMVLILIQPMQTVQVVLMDPVEARTTDTQMGQSSTNPERTIAVR